MKLFGRKDEDQGEAPEAPPAASPPHEAPDPSTWALPADAAVAAAGSTVGPATPAGGADRASTSGAPPTSSGLSAAAVTAPSAGAGADPAASAAAQEASSAPPPRVPPTEGAADVGGESPGATGPAYGSGSPAGSTLAAAQQKPEVMVAGAFVGAFLAARILRRITE